MSGVVTVLVADDDPDYRLMVRLGLHGAPGFAPALEAATAPELLEVAAAHRPDVVLLDVALPGGFEAAAGLPGSPRVVLVSSRPPDELAAVAAAVGASGYIGKDLAPSDLPAAVADVTHVVDRLQAVLAKAHDRFPAHVRSAGEARTVVRRTLEGWCDEDRLDDIALCVSELITNAVIHADSEPQLLVHVRPGVIHVEISDESDVLPVVRGAGPEDTSGRGVSILGMLSDRWGALRRSGGGKTVWFDFERSPQSVVGGER
ncbi:MAG: ATP-binding protein [Acidimicrobiia bacterium]